MYHGSLLMKYNLESSSYLRSDQEYLVSKYIIKKKRLTVTDTV